MFVTYWKLFFQPFSFVKLIAMIVRSSRCWACMPVSDFLFPFTKLKNLFCSHLSEWGSKTHADIKKRAHTQHYYVAAAAAWLEKDPLVAHLLCSARGPTDGAPLICGVFWRNCSTVMPCNELNYEVTLNGHSAKQRREKIIMIIISSSYADGKAGLPDMQK